MTGTEMKDEERGCKSSARGKCKSGFYRWCCPRWGDNTYKSWWCTNAAFSALGINVVFSFLALTSVLSFMSASSLLSIGSVNSMLSIFSINCFMCIGCQGAAFCRSDNFSGAKEALRMLPELLRARWSAR
eukprot:Plantae.Rhodophyta-Hildenbrandia_rubra.ctg10156.p1 GENE.Plantae.Rhodophyta-Hildenbrandia_rubra.ctg10156~~Plantae.Rhodophyta-Hildenbrandia_rubra.ctg10156.p1  ORF type:complete len:130 (+),score=2.56 Plantae.Rhodophyta-Hildenbrandia_rubra.ctg10156:342-731(+)